MVKKATYTEEQVHQMLNMQRQQLSQQYQSRGYGSQGSYYSGDGYD